MAKSSTPEYRAWSAMKGRCFNPRHRYFSHYGKRGITVCERWLTFENFLADMGPRPGWEYSLDRIDVNGNYEPGNCRWATQADQNNNRRNNIYLTLNGETKTLTQWADSAGLSSSGLQSRLRKMSLEQALTAPRQSNGCRRAVYNEKPDE